MIGKKALAVLLDDETMKQLFKAGLISTKPFFYRDIYLWVDTQLTLRKISKNKVVIEASIKFKTSEDTIKRAIRTFKN